MADKPKNKFTVPLVILLTVVVLIILILPILAIARLWLEYPPASLTDKRQPTTQPVPFNAEAREQVRDFVAHEVDRQTGRSLQHFNTMATVIITIVTTLIAVAVAIFGFSWWRQTKEYEKVMEKAETYHTEIKDTAGEVEKELIKIKKIRQTIEADAKSSEASAEAAVKSLEAAYRSSKAASYAMRGLTYENKGVLDRAIEEYNKAIALEPKNAGLYYNRGLAWLKKDDFEEAIKDCNKVIGLNPNDADCYGNRGLARDGKGEFDRAIKDFDKAIKLDPKKARHYSNRGNAWSKKGEFDNAIGDHNKAIKLEPKNAGFYSNRGNVWNKKGEFNKAFNDYNKALELDPKDAGYYLTVVETRIFIRDFRQAVEQLEQGRSYNIFKGGRDHLISHCLEGIALALGGKDASAAETEAKRLLTAGTKASEWYCDPMNVFLESLKPDDFPPDALKTAKRIQEILKSAC